MINTSVKLLYKIVVIVVMSFIAICATKQNTPGKTIFAFANQRHSALFN